MSTRPANAENSRIEYKTKELRTERLHFENSLIEFEVGPAGVIAKIRDGGPIEYAGPLEQQTIDALFDAGERDVWADKDPHGLLPEDFKRQYDSIREAEEKESSTDFESEKRCPECDSHRWRGKQDDLKRQPNRNPAPYKCLNCSHHFRIPSEPDESKEGEE